jgi:hypothetical protein
VFSLVVTRLSRPRTEQALRLCQWRLLALGTHTDILKERGGRFDVLIIGRFAEKLIKALQGETGIVEPSYVYLPGVEGGEEIAKETGIDFFSVPIELGVS